MQRAVTSVHPKRHERRTDGLVGRMQGRSSVPSHKVAPLAPASKEEDLLISFDDCSVAPSTVTGARPPVSQSNVDVLSLLDSSVAEKYERLPPALGEQRRVPYDPFEVSEDLKNYASQTATPLHSGGSVITSQQYDTASLHHSWSSFDSFSSQDNDAELTSPPQNQTSDRMYSSTSAGRTFTAGTAGASTKTSSDTDLLTYANVPLWPEDNSANQHSYSYSDCSRSSNRRSRRCDGGNEATTSRRVNTDVNANSVAPRPVSIAVSADWVTDAMSQLALVSQSSSLATSPALEQTLAAASASWDGNRLARSMRAAKKKVPTTGSVFYDDVDDDQGDMTQMISGESSAPPVPPRDYLREDGGQHTTQAADGIYTNVGFVGDRTRSYANYDTNSTRQMAEVRPFLQTSADVYQNYSEFSQSNADQTVYANIHEQSAVHRNQGNRSSFIEATTRGATGWSGDLSGTSAVQQVRWCVPAATAEECQTALVHCYGNVESATKHLKVEQLTRLGIAPRERCRSLLIACSWNLESAGSVLLHELTTGSPV